MKSRYVFAPALLALAATLTCPNPASAEGKVYNHLVIQAFATPEGAEIPADFAQMLRRNLKVQLGKTNRFRAITVVEPGEAVPADADLELSGEITRFKKGSAAKRYWSPVPGLMGNTRINAIVEFKDLPTGQTLWKADVSGKVVYGNFSSLGATNGLAKDVAKIVKKKM
jgi:hypothetical protein